MLVQLASSKVLVATVGNAVSTKTLVIEVGPHNHANLTIHVRDIVSLHGSPTAATLSVVAVGSNDGQKWAEVPGFSTTTSATGVKPMEGDVLFAFLRFDLNLSVTGSVGDEAEVVFCMQVNLIEG